MTTRKTIIITGGTGGIGYQAALGLAKTGAHVVVTGRNPERGEAAKKRIADESQNPNVELAIGDVSSRAGVEALATDLLQRFERIDVLINNAGFLGSVEEKTADGFEKHFGINVAAPYWLTQALLPALKAGAPSRVLNVTGGTPTRSLDTDNLEAEKGFKGLSTYSDSKCAMEAMSLALARELEPQGVFVNVIYPGGAATAMTGGMSMDTLPGPMKLLWPVFKLMMQRDDGGKSAAKAARSSVWAATTPDLDGVSGAYYWMNLKRKKLHATVRVPQAQQKVIARITGAAG